jgi:hypothetical protein
LSRARWATLPAGPAVSTALRKPTNSWRRWALHAAAEDGAVEYVEGGEQLAVPWRL